MRIFESATEAAYMAGIIDGEGCIYVNRRKVCSRRKTPGYSLKVAVTITSPEIVEWFKQHAKLTSIFYQHNPGPNRKPRWLCTWNNSAGLALLQDIRPYLIIKAPQADLGIELMHHLSATHGGTGVQVAPEAITYRESIKLRISKLNRRGRVDTSPTSV